MSSLKEDMRGLFYIVRGNYSKTEPKVLCDDGEERYIGGYDPESNREWYRVLDTETFFCSYAGGDYDKALEVIKHQITHFKSRKRYFKWVCEVSSEDYYFTHYLGHSPFTHDQYLRRCEGRMPRVSVPQKSMERTIYNMWGHYFDEDIEMVEDSAYEYLEEKEKILEKKKSRIKLKKKPTPVIESSLKHEDNEHKKIGVKKKSVLKKRVKLIK